MAVGCCVPVAPGEYVISQLLLVADACWRVQGLPPKLPPVPPLLKVTVPTGCVLEPDCGEMSLTVAKQAIRPLICTVVASQLTEVAVWFRLLLGEWASLGM